MMCMLSYLEARSQLEKVLDEEIRPYIESHGGTIEVADIDLEEGLVEIRMEGACSGCEAALATLRFGVEVALKKHLSWVKRVRLVNEPIEPDFNIDLS